MENDKNERMRRCPRLGGNVLFTYCFYGYDEKKDGTSACFKIFDCWWETFDVDAWIRNALTEEEYENLRNKAADMPQPKVLSLLELIEKARENARKE